MYYKATDVNGRDFRTGILDYAGALTAGSVVEHPNMYRRMIPDLPGTYLSTSVEPGETLIGGIWPCRLFVIEPIGEVLDGLRASEYKRACKSLRVVEELPAHQALGPNGEYVAALIERASTLTYDEVQQLDAARFAAGDAAWFAAGDAAGDAAWFAARYAAWFAAGDAAGDAAWFAARYAARDAAGDAARALSVRDKLAPKYYRVLTAHLSSVIGKVHPDDEDV